MNDLSNDELCRLLKQFALGQSPDQATRQAQRAFYDAVRRPLERTVSHALMRRPDLCRAAVQESWNQVFLSAARYDGQQGPVMAWVKGIALNCARTVARKEASATRWIQPSKFHGNRTHGDDWSDDDADWMDTAACPMPGPEQMVHASQIRHAVANCLDRLPTDGRVPYRQVYELALDSELSHRELADLFNAQHPERPPCNEEQLRKWVARAGDKMRECVGALLRLPAPTAR